MAKSFARIHRANLINFGILPLEFQNDSDFELLAQGRLLSIENIADSLKKGASAIEAIAGSDRIAFKVDLTPRQRQVMLSGGLLNYIRSQQGS
jgi:aconitate hydratase